MTTTTIAPRPVLADAASRTARLDQALAAAKAAVILLDETSDAARCEDCAHLPGECPCPHFCTPRGI